MTWITSLSDRILFSPTKLIDNNSKKLMKCVEGIHTEKDYQLSPFFHTSTYCAFLMQNSPYKY